MKMVPDPVYELIVDSTNKKLDLQGIRFIPNELDEHALEEGLILKERYGGTLRVLAIDAPDLDGTLYSALAKGADEVFKVSRTVEGVGTQAIVESLALILKKLTYDLVLVGVQAIDDIDGEVGPFLSIELDHPYLGVVTQIALKESERVCIVRKAFAGGLQGEYEVKLPAVLGVQSAENPPRYVPLAKVRKIKTTAKIKAIVSQSTGSAPTLDVSVMKPAEGSKLVTMLDGSTDEIVSKIIGILTGEGVLGR
jgi:electron transfer flavoprotein beta subunit